MGFFDSCFGEYTDASELLSSIPNEWGQAREDAIYREAQEGNVPYFLRNWMEVPVSAKGHSGSFFALPDYFALGTDKDFVRIPMSPTTAEKIGALLGARLPTKKMVDLVHIAALQRIRPEPMKPTAQMTTRDYFVRHNNKIEKRAIEAGFTVGPLTSGHKKDVVVTSGMSGKNVCIYGWFKNDSPTSAIQGPRPNCRSHSLLYSDYSHGIRFVRDFMIVDGKQMLVDDVLADPELAPLISDEGTFASSRYDSTHRPTLEPSQVITTALFAFLGFSAGLQLMS